MRYIFQNVRHIPVPSCNATDKSLLAKLAERAAKLAVTGDVVATTKIEREIDDVVFRLFDLTREEIAAIEGALASTRGGGSDGDDGGEDE